jgi:hypothetical protein
MKKLSYLILAIFFVAFSCQEKPEEPVIEACGVKNPVKELTWLAEKTAQYEPTELGSYFYITQAEYNKESIFIMRNCCPYCNTAITAYNCEGTLLGVVSQNSEIDPGSILNEKVIWKPVNSSCSI